MANIHKVYTDFILENDLVRPGVKLLALVAGRKVRVKEEGNVFPTEKEIPGHIKSDGPLGELAREIWEKEANPFELLKFGQIPNEHKVLVCRRFLERLLSDRTVSEDSVNFFYRRELERRRWHCIMPLISANHRPRKDRKKMVALFREIFFDVVKNPPIPPPMDEDDLDFYRRWMRMI